MRVRKRRVDGVVQRYNVTPGDCYKRAGTLIYHFKRGVLCHGMVFHPKTGWHGHAWIEDGDMVIDTKHIPKVVYYAIGKVKDVKRYTPLEAAEHMDRSGHYGPWK